VSWRDTIEIHPACGLFPPMSEDELRATGEDIKARGLTHPIVLWTPPYADTSDEDLPPAVLLDGKNRLDAMELVGLNPRFSDDLEPELTEGAIPRIATHTELEAIVRYPVEFLGSDVDPWEYVRSANVLRRHQTAEAKRKSIADLIAAQPKLSNRQIAKQADADQKTLAAVRQAKEARGEIPHVDTRTDTKGRKQPARKRKTEDKPPPKKKLSRVVEIDGKPVTADPPGCPTEAEAEKSYQDTLFEHSCSMWREMTSETQRRFLA
jgi:hypothetical protein